MCVCVCVCVMTVLCRPTDLALTYATFKFEFQSNLFPWAPGTIFGICCLILPVCMRMLAETSGRELPQTIEEMTLYITTPYEIAKKKKLSEKKKPGLV